MKWFLALVLGVAFFYRDSFFSRFFQDDFHLLELSKQSNLLTPIANFPYRPVAIQLYYGLGILLGGSENVLVFHLLAFFCFLAALYFIFKLTDSKLVVFLYAFNISLFPLFYWTATSYFLLAAFFVFGGLFFFVKRKWLLGFLFFVLGLLSNELVIVFPCLWAIWAIYKKLKLTWPFWLATLVDLIYLLFRQTISNPNAVDYTVDISWRVLATARWYLLRIFNLPEGIKNGAGGELYVLFIVLLGIVILCWRRIKLRELLFAFSWFFVGALPFFFLPFHMSAYYLTISLFGPFVLLDHYFFGRSKSKILFCLSYLLLGLLGIDFLSETHWIILKPL